MTFMHIVLATGILAGSAGVAWWGQRTVSHYRVGTVRLYEEAQKLENSLRDARSQAGSLRDHLALLQQEMERLRSVISKTQPMMDAVPLGMATWGTAYSFIDFPKRVLKLISVAPLDGESLSTDANALLGLSVDQSRGVVQLLAEMDARSAE